MSRPFTPATTQKQRAFYSDLPVEVPPKGPGVGGGGSNGGGGTKRKPGPGASTSKGPHTHLSTRHHAVNPQVVPTAASFVPDLAGGWDPHAAEVGAAVASPVAAGTPRKASEPKVQMPYVCPAGTVPRKVEVERRKRAFAQMDINVLLEMKWLRVADMLPGGEHVTDEIPADGGAFLPLEVFDDTEYEAVAFRVSGHHDPP